MWAVNSVLKDTTEIKDILKDLLKKAENWYKELIKEIKKMIDDFKKDLITEISDEICNKIVGESYYKWNSTNSFYPTLMFKFKEENINNRTRTTQLKLKLNEYTKFYIFSVYFCIYGIMCITLS